jgi:hypothetical protein
MPFSAYSPWGVSGIELTPLGSYARDYGSREVDIKAPTKLNIPHTLLKPSLDAYYIPYL